MTRLEAIKPIDDARDSIHAAFNQIDLLIKERDEARRLQSSADSRFDELQKRFDKLTLDFADMRALKENAERAYKNAESNYLEAAKRIDTLVNEKEANDALIQTKDKTETRLKNVINFAWRIISNVSGGRWTHQSDTWIGAASEWRDRAIRDKLIPYKEGPETGYKKIASHVCLVVPDNMTWQPLPGELIVKGPYTVIPKGRGEASVKDSRGEASDAFSQNQGYAKEPNCPLKFNNPWMRLWIEADGMMFRVLLTTGCRDVANGFMASCKESVLIATDNQGIHYVANLRPTNLERK
jgi:hypothetical protein